MARKSRSRVPPGAEEPAVAVTAAKPRAEKSKPREKAYVIDLDAPDFHSVRKYVKFIGGIGVLSKAVYRLARPDFFLPDGTQHLGVKFDQWPDYWVEHGAKVTEISAEDAEALIKELETGESLPGKFYRVAPSKRPDRQPEKPKGEYVTDEAAEETEAPAEE